MLKKVKEFEGLHLKIEQPAGTARMGRGGKQWRREMGYNYGYIEGTEGVDGDEIDVFFPPHKFWSNKIYVIHQVNPTSGTYDEDKLMCGFESEEDAIEAYKMHYPDPDKRLGPITLWNAEELKEILKKTKGKPGKLDKDARTKWLSGRNADIVKKEPALGGDLEGLLYNTSPQALGSKKDAQLIMDLGLAYLRSRR